jgi:tetratricopeptide (TPR) repeat protein
LEKAKTLEQLGNYKEAIDNYLITLELDDPTAFVYIRIGECYEKLRKLDAAVSFYKKAVHEDPLLDKAWILLANIYFEQENYQKAAYYLAKALKIDDDNALYWKRYAEINLRLSFFEEAVTGFSSCLRLGDTSPEIYLGLVDVLSFSGEFNDALKVILEAQKIHKDFAEVEYRLVGLFLILNKEKYALSHLIKAMKIDYDYHTILNELYPIVCDNLKIQKLLMDYKKAME